MAIFNDINPASTSGTALAGILNSFKDSVASGFIGATRPTNLQAGGNWIDNSTVGTDDLIKYKYFDGTDDILIFTVNVDTNAVSVAGVDLSAIEGDIADLEADMATVLSDITTLQGDVSDLNAAVTSTQGEVDAVETALANHIADTTTHGTTGDIVGTSDTQVLTNKDIDGGTAANNRRITVPKNTTANLTGLTRKEGTVAYSTDEQSLMIDDGTDLVAVGSGSGSGQGFKNYVTDPNISRNLKGVKSYKDFSFLNNGGGGFTDGGGAGTILAFPSHGFTTNQRVAYFTDITPLDGATTLKGVVGYINVINTNSFYISATQGGAAVPLSDGGGVNSTHYFRVYYTTAYQTPHLTAVLDNSTQLAGKASMGLTFTDNGTSAVAEGMEIVTGLIDRQDMGEVFYIKVEANMTNAAYPPNDLVFRAVDLTNQKLLPLADNYMIRRIQDGYLVPVYAPDTARQILISVHLATDTATTDWSGVFGTWFFGPGQTVAGDRTIIEYAANTAGTTTAGATASDATSINGGPGSLAELGAAIGNIASTTANSRTTFTCKFSDNHTPSDKLNVEINIGNGWINASDIYPHLGANTSRYGILLSAAAGANIAQVGFGNNGSFTVGATYGANGDAWSGLSTARWRVKRTRVVKTSFSATELTAKGTRASYSSTSGQSIPNNTVTIVDFATRAVDNQNSVTTGAAWKFTAKERMDLTVNAQLEWNVQAAAANSIWALILYKNGVEVVVLDEKSPLVTSVTQRLALNGSYDIEVQAGDYIDIRVFQNDGGNRGFVTGAGRNYVNIKQNIDPKVFAQAGPVQNIQDTYIRLAVSTAQHTNSGNWQDILWSVQRDDLGEFNAGTGVFTPRETGDYEIDGTFSFAGSTATGSRGIRIYDGTTGPEIAASPGFTGIGNAIPLSRKFPLTANVAYKFQGWQTSGGNLTYNSGVGSVITIKRVRQESRVTGVTGVTLVTATSAVKTPTASSNYALMTGNGLSIVQPGVYRLFGHARFSNGGVSPSFTALYTSWNVANGADTIFFPAALNTGTGVTILSASPYDLSMIPTNGSFGLGQAEEVIIRVTQPITIYLVPRADLSGVASNARIQVFATAEYIGKA